MFELREDSPRQVVENWFLVDSEANSICHYLAINGHCNPVTVRSQNELLTGTSHIQSLSRACKTLFQISSYCHCISTALLIYQRVTHQPFDRSPGSAIS
jgi:hypothetical protein